MGLLPLPTPAPYPGRDDGAEVIGELSLQLSQGTAAVVDVPRVLPGHHAPELLTVCSLQSHRQHPDPWPRAASASCGAAMHPVALIHPSSPPALTSLAAAMASSPEGPSARTTSTAGTLGRRPAPGLSR